MSKLGKKMLKMSALLIAAMAFCASAATAETVIDFTNTNGYGMDADHVMIENIQVDVTISNPFDPTRPEIISNYYNVPFVFDYSTLHLVPDLGSSVVVNDDTSCASLSVYVSDASTGSVISGATVEVGSSTATTNSDGLATFSNLVAGSALIEGNAANYVAAERQVTLSCEEAVSVGLALSPESGAGALEANEARIVLSWGENPRDLDSHLTGPNASSDGSTTDTTNRFHVYYSHRTEDAANLDVDDTSSYGPETITLTPPDGSGSLRPGLYRYSVHHYSGSSDISNSNASVTLTAGSSTRTFTPPAGSPGDDALWTVFELYVNASGGMTVYEINTYSADVSPSSVTSTSTGYGSVETGIDFTRLPAK